MNEAQFYNLIPINRPSGWSQAFAIADHNAVNILVDMPFDTSWSEYQRVNSLKCPAESKRTPIYHLERC